jgi:hypothetical protein
LSAISEGTVGFINLRAVMALKLPILWMIRQQSVAGLGCPWIHWCRCIGSRPSLFALSLSKTMVIHFFGDFGIHQTQFKTFSILSNRCRKNTIIPFKASNDVNPILKKTAKNRSASMIVFEKRYRFALSLLNSGLFVYFDSHRYLRICFTFTILRNNTMRKPFANITQ